MKFIKFNLNGIKNHIPIIKKNVRKSYQHPLTGNILDDVTILESYDFDKDYPRVNIVEDNLNKMRIYCIIEPRLNYEELEVYNDVMHALEYEINIPREYTDPLQYFIGLLNKIVAIYGLARADVDLDKIKYYATRDMIGLGALEPLILDPNIEDISVNGIDKPVYIWHRKYENLPTNLIFKEPKLLDNNVIRLVHLGGKHISTANPIVDAALPGGHRLHATYRNEVSPHGSSITIRKFREVPITIIDLIKNKTINYIIAAYAWLLMENRTTATVIGSTGSGKTTTLNALLSLIPSNAKIITIEEVKEINIHHKNWVPLLVRFSYLGDKSSTVSAFKLVKAAMRMRPDILVIGEVRGEEAYSLFQALSTGHGGMFTMHAEDTNSALQRLISKPMNVAPSYIQFLDLAFIIRRVNVGNRLVRRIISIDEIIDINTRTRIFEWNAKTDKFVMRKLQESIKLRRVAQMQGYDINELIQEFGRRIKILYWLNTNNITDFRDITEILQRYRNDPDMFDEKVTRELRDKGINIEKIIQDMFRESMDAGVTLDLRSQG